MRIFAMLLAAATLLTVGCEDPAANKTKATVAEPVGIANTAAGPAQPKGESLAISPQNSKVEFTGSKVTGKHDGGFREFSGTIDLVEMKPQLSSVDVNIDTASIYSDDDNLTKHLKSNDFFDVEKNPTARFTSTKIEPAADGGDNAYNVTGDLTLRGTTKSVTFPATIKVDPLNVGVSAEFAVNRKNFGMVYAGKADDLIRDDVVIKLTLNAARKQ